MENWCEYVSQDGEVRNVLQLFCECEDLDESFTNLVSSSTSSTSTAAGPPAWERVLGVAQDRARLPWPGGARRIDLAWLLAAALLWLLRFAARRSTSLAQTVVVVSACFGGLGYSHHRALRRRSGSQFHVAWLALSVLGLYSRYRRADGDAENRAMLPSKTADVMVHFCLLAMVACFGHCCLADPGREELVGEVRLAPAPAPSGRQAAVVRASVGVAGEDDGDAEPGRALRERQARRSLLLRAGHCSICRCTFRLRDHHCVWVGQCVAERNRRSFLGFLVLLAGLSVWFSRRTIVLSAAATSGCSDAWRACEQPVWSHVADLMRRNRGGEDVGAALYAFAAGLLGTALAAQQIFLVSAGLTSLELRRGRKPPSLPHAHQDRDSASSADRSASRSADRSQPWQGRRRTPAAAGAAAFESQSRARPQATLRSARDIVGNWVRFLAGTELPDLQRRPVPSPQRP